MKRFLLPLVLLASTAPPASADQRDCEADLRALVASPVGRLAGTGLTLEEGAGSALPRPVFENGRCVLRNVELPFSEAPSMQQAVHADLVAWTMQWPDAARTFPPTRLVLEAAGLRLDYGYEGIDPAIAYGMRLLGETAANEAALDYAYDPAAESFALHRMSLGNSRDRVDFSATFEHFRPEAFFSPEKAFDAMLQARLSRLDVQFTNSVFFESMASLWLQLILPQFGATPDEAVVGAKDEARRQIAAVPDTIASPAARGAAAAAVESLPHPTGTLRLSVSAPDGLALSDIGPALAAGVPTWAELAPRLRGARIDVQWLPRKAE